MPGQDPTELQFQVLRCLMGDEKPGRDLRELLNKLGKKRSNPAFYTLMARCEKAKFVEGRYEKFEVDGMELRERWYKITQGGVAAHSAFLERMSAPIGLEPSPSVVV